TKTAEILCLGFGCRGRAFLQRSQLMLLQRSHALFCQQVEFFSGNQRGKAPPQHRSMYCGRASIYSFRKSFSFKTA
ncbi:hypothetical protein BWZ27_12565, partial [Neisseria meningitidis]